MEHDPPHIPEGDGDGAKRHAQHDGYDEQRGQDQIIEFALAGQKIKAIADAATVLRAGDSISLSLRENRCYFFDAETGARVR